MHELARYEEPLAMLAPKMADVLPVTMDPSVINRTVLHALSQNSYLAKADPNSVLGCAMTAAVLGLQVDGFSGQGYMLPFASRGGVKAQFITGYKGDVTLADRALRTLIAGVVLEDDIFEFDEATGDVRHQRKLGHEKDRQVVAAWARTTAMHVPPACKVLSYDQITDRRDVSNGYKAFKKGTAKSSVWADNFQAMAQKSAVIELSKFIPVIPLQLAAQLSVQSDLGRHAQLNEHGNMVIDGELVDPATVSPTPATSRANVQAPKPSPDPRTPVYAVHMPDGNGGVKTVDKKNLELWLSYMELVWGKAGEKNLQPELARLNQETVLDLVRRHDGVKLLSQWVDRFQGVLDA